MKKNNVRKYRKLKKMTIAQLAKEANISQRIFMSFRKGKKTKSINGGDEQYSKNTKYKYR
jgi:DNA-binding XRE family transcriptional regulator